MSRLGWDQRCDAETLAAKVVVALAVVIDRDEVLLSRGGTFTVTRSDDTGFEGRIEATVAVQETEGGRDEPGVELRVRGAYAVRPGADPFIIIN